MMVVEVQSVNSTQCSLVCYQCELTALLGSSLAAELGASLEAALGRMLDSVCIPRNVQGR